MRRFTNTRTVRAAGMLGLAHDTTVTVAIGEALVKHALRPEMTGRFACPRTGMSVRVPLRHASGGPLPSSVLCLRPVLHLTGSD